MHCLASIGCRTTSNPFTRIVPEVGLDYLTIIFMVVASALFGPRNPKNLPAPRVMSDHYGSKIAKFFLSRFGVGAWEGMRFQELVIDIQFIRVTAISYRQRATDVC